MKKILIILILFSIALSQAKTWVREYTYQASEADSKLTSRAISLEQVKRLLLQEIGVYVHSTILSGEFEASGEVKDLSSKQIEIISAGITETKIIEENWNGKTYYIKAEITADENDVIKRLDNLLKDKSKTKQLEESRRKTDDALTEIDRLNNELEVTKKQNIALENQKMRLKKDKTRLSKIEVEKKKQELELERVTIENEKLKIKKSYNQSSNQLTAEDWFQKGCNAAQIKEYDYAISYWQKALIINPYLDDAYCYIGIAYNEKGDYDKAILNTRKAIEINPNLAYAYYNLGVTYYNKIDPSDPGRNFRNSVKYCLKSISINPNSTDNIAAYYLMGRAYIALGNYDKYIECKQRAARLGDKESQSDLKFIGISW